MMADDSSPEILVDCCEKHTTTVDMKETDHQQQTIQQVNQFDKKMPLGPPKLLVKSKINQFHDKIFKKK